jgi:hypothetical protein
MVLRSGTVAAVDLVPHDDIDVEAWVKNWVHGQPADGLVLTPEIDRALRSMSRLARRRHRGGDGKLVYDDPLRELRIALPDDDQLTEEVMRRIDLPLRRTRSLICPDGEDGVGWLETTVAKINSGQQPEVSIPKTMTITLPMPLAPNLPFRIDAVDTRGIEGTTQREDLMGHIESRRTLSFLCSLFPAIDGSLLRLLRYDREARLRGADEDRLMLLMVAKGNEAEEVLDDAGLAAGSVDDGYLIKESHVRQVLTNEGLGEIPVLFYNPYREKPVRLWGDVEQQLQAIRNHWYRVAQTDLDFVDRLETETDLVRVEQGLARLRHRLTALATEVRSLPDIRRSPKRNLLQEMEQAHPSVLAASMRRQGRYPTFSVPYVLATGCRIIANSRSMEMFERISVKLQALATELSDVGPVRALMEVLHGEMENARQNFLRQVQDYANRSFSSYFEEPAEPARWTRIAEEWGRGSGYRGRVNARFDEWFENDEQLIEQVKAVHAQTSELWRHSVVGRLETACEEAHVGSIKRADAGQQ